MSDTELRRLHAENAEQAQEIEGLQECVIKQGEMLRAIVNLIRGEPPEGTAHSTHDVVELVRGLAMHNDLYVSAATHESAALKAENEALREANEAFGKRQEWWNDKMFALEALNAELVEALQSVVAWMDAPDESAFSDGQLAAVRAALAKAGVSNG